MKQIYLFYISPEKHGRQTVKINGNSFTCMQSWIQTFQSQVQPSIDWATLAPQKSNYDNSSKIVFVNFFMHWIAGVKMSFFFPCAVSPQDPVLWRPTNWLLVDLTGVVKTRTRATIPKVTYRLTTSESRCCCLIDSWDSLWCQIKALGITILWVCSG